MTNIGTSWTPYLPVARATGETTDMPALRFVLQSGTRRVQAVGIVDSGSEHSVLPPPVARRLALWPPAPSETLEGIGADVRSGLVMADIRLMLAAGPMHLAAVQFRVPLVGDRPRFVILGRHPLFDEAQVTFQDWAHRLSITPRRRDWWLTRAQYRAPSLPSRLAGRGSSPCPPRT